MNQAVSAETQSLLESAASEFASGAVKQAEQRLVEEIKRHRGAVDARVWHMLLDIYQVENQHEVFETLATFYANYFHVLPPAWREPAQTVVREKSGRDALVIEGPIAQVRDDKIQDFLASSRKSQHARLDISRARLPDTPSERAEAWRLLQRIMSRLRRFQVATLLMGEQQLVEQLREQIQANEGSDEVLEPAWLALLEFLQWRGQQDAFETMADAYAQRFEISPPGYDADGVVAVVPDDRHVPATQLRGDRVIPPAQVDVDNVAQLQEAIRSQLAGLGQVQVDWSEVRRLTYEAALSLAQFFSERSVSPDRLQMIQINELHRVILEMAQAGAWVTMRPYRQEH